MTGAENNNSNPPVYKYNSPLRDIIIIFICIFGTAVSLWFFIRDTSKNRQQLIESPVGTVYWVSDTAKRLSANLHQWERLERNSPIYNGDTISSAAFSDVKISFTNGETLELSENTSVRIRYLSGEIPSIDLLEGEIDVQSSHLNLIIFVAANNTEGTRETSPANSQYRVSLDSRTIANIKTFDRLTAKVYQGSGTVTSRSRYFNIGEGETVKADDEGLFVPASRIIMLSPRNGNRILRTERGTGPVKFEWQKTRDNNDSEIILEISAARDFSRNVEKWVMQNTSSSEIKLSEGIYYWKLYTPSHQKDFDSGRLDIIYSPASRALFPANGSVISLLPGMRDLRFSFSVPEEAESVLLEVADNPEMNRPRLRQLVRRTRYGRGIFKSSELVTGQWYWRIHPVFPRQANSNTIQAESPSAINSFTIVEGQPVSRTRITVPVAGAGTVHRNIFPPDNHILEASRTPDLLFTWKVPGSHKSRFQIATNLDFADSVIIDEEVSGMNYRGPMLKPGSYYWRVTGDAAEHSSIPSRLVIIPNLQGPRLISPAENQVLRAAEGVPIRFNWDRVAYANYYTFSLYLAGRELPMREVSSIHNNSVVVYFDARTSGRFIWTVRGFSTPTESTTGRIGLVSQGYFDINPDPGVVQGDQVSWTIPRIANIETYYGEVDSPIKLISPASGTNISGVQALRFPIEAWWASDLPLRNVQLFVSTTPDPSSDPGAYVRDAGGSSVVFPSLGEGIWYWTIRADTDEWQGVTPGNPFWFNVLSIPQFPPPTAIKPADESVIDLNQLTRDRNITFNWDAVDNANAYIFSLYVERNAPVLLYSTPPQTELSFVFDNLPILENGNYFWQVEAVYRNLSGAIEQRGVTVPHSFRIEIQRSSEFQTHSLGVTYGQ